MRLLGLTVAVVSFASQLLSAAAFTNPIKDPNGSDPFMVYHEGYYCEYKSLNGGAPG